MTEENKNPTPASPEVQSPEVRQVLEQDNVTHQGQAVKTNKAENDSQRHMGTIETDVTPITPPMAGPSDLVGDTGEQQPPVDPQSEITPG